MPIVNADAKSLEWITYLFLSQDPVGCKEWLEFNENPKLNDIHTRNQNDLNLVSRLIAKIFLFRCIYRGPALSYQGKRVFRKYYKDKEQARIELNLEILKKLGYVESEKEVSHQ